MTQIVCIGLGISKIKMGMLLKWSRNKCSIYEERESSEIIVFLMLREQTLNTDANAIFCKFLMFSCNIYKGLHY